MKHALVFAIGLIFAARPAIAQDMGWSTITPSITGTDTLGLVLREKMEERSPPTPDGRPARTPPTAAPVSATALTYRVSPARRQANLDNFIRKTRTQSPALADDLTKLFASGDTFGTLATAMAPYGLKIDNLGDALATYWIVAWQASRGHNDDFDRAAVSAVRDQTALALAEMPSIASANDAAKQEFAEALWIHAIMLDSAVGQSKGNEALLRMLAARARQHASEMGIDVTAMTLTKQGFVPVK